MRQYTRYGLLQVDDQPERMIHCIVKGEMADGSKVWNEIDPKTKEVINETDLLLFTRGGWSVFTYL